MPIVIILCRRFQVEPAFACVCLIPHIGIHAAQLIRRAGIKILPGNKIKTILTKKLQIRGIDIADAPGQTLLEPVWEHGFFYQLITLFSCKLIFRRE